MHQTWTDGAYCYIIKQQQLAVLNTTGMLRGYSCGKCGALKALHTALTSANQHTGGKHEPSPAVDPETCCCTAPTPPQSLSLQCYCCYCSERTHCKRETRINSHLAVLRIRM
jgi:hypothetical protein